MNESEDTRSRIRIRIGDVEFEVEGKESMVKEYYKNFKEGDLDKYLATVTTQPVGKTEPCRRPSAPLDFDRPESLLEFVDRIKPKKKNEIAATIAYYLEHLADKTKEEWEINEVMERFTDARSEKPKNPPDTLKKSNFFMKGRQEDHWRLTRTGVDWVEKRMKTPQTDS